MLAYPVRQQVRWWLEEWANLELALGALFFLFLLFGTREGKPALLVTLGIYAIVLFERFFTLPQMLFFTPSIRLCLPTDKPVWSW